MKILASFFLAAFISISALATQTKFSRVISFGDSLSDVGTYFPIAAFKGGGKFTTNPGKIWIENVATDLGLPMKQNRTEGYGTPTNILGGFNYAQGGARIVFQGSTGTKFSARPLTTQVGYFLSEHKEFLATDLVFIQGGANDLMAQLRAVKDHLITAQQALENMVQAADDFSVIIANVKNSGAQSVVVLNLPAIERTPHVMAYDATTKAFVAQMVQSFNAALAVKTAGYDVLLLDIYNFDQNFNLHYKELGFVNIDQPACKLQDLVGRLALFCSARSLVEPGAELHFKFADDLHPTTGFSQVIRDFVWPMLQTRFGL